MNALSPSENIEKIVRLLFRIQVREDKVFTRFLKILECNRFKIIDFDEILRRVTGYSTITSLENILKILEEYALSYSFEVTAILKTKSINRIVSNAKLLSRKEGFLRKLYEYKNISSYIFYKRRWWLIQIIKNKGIVKIILLRKQVFPLEMITPYYYTFYDLRDTLLAKEEILKDLKDIILLLDIE